MLTANEIRRRYLAFFKRLQHQIVPSGPLIPANDPTLLFTNAGMVQFKKLFLGDENKPYTRATSCQKCLRVSGKHNDLENVGRTARHHTFFEMLGNFSFGDYFKKDAIKWAWEFVTRELELPQEKLWVTIYKDDEEAFRIWKEISGLPEDRIVRMGEMDNFWTMGDTGPCGPCSEIYYDQGPEMACGSNCGIGQCDCDRFLEIWNLVFTQYDQSGDGVRTLLASPNIDTGMGLERIAAVCQGKQSNFDCDLFQEIIQYAAQIANVKYSFSPPDTNDVDTALRVIADHARAAAFLIAEGVIPSNETRGYVLRRLIRRALRFATLMGIHEPFMYKVAGKTADIMGETYPELLAHREFIEKVVREEESRFALTLETGLQLLDEELERLKKSNKNVIDGDFCFKLYDTHGFPIDIVNDIASKRGFAVDVEEFNRKMEDQRNRARSHQKKEGLFGPNSQNELSAECAKLVAEGLHSIFIGYTSLYADSKILALLDTDARPLNVVSEGERAFLVVEKTPFYAESGGQTGDYGVTETISGKALVKNVIKPDPALILHEIEVVDGTLKLHQEISLQVDTDSRLATARNHTCTHLLHSALRRVLGSHVKQAGSLVDSTHLRFDFTHPSFLSSAELAAVEREVNRAIMEDYPVTASEMDLEEARACGAMALFSEKYGNRVRVLTIGNDKGHVESMELCGGTHLERTGQAASFLITSSGSISSGIKRIEAVTGWNAYNVSIGMRGSLHDTAALLKVSPDQICEKIKNILDEYKKTKKDAPKSLSNQFDIAKLAANAEEIGDIKCVCKKFDDIKMPVLLEMMDELRNRLSHHGVICLAGIDGGKVSLALYVSKDLQQKFTAPALIKPLAEMCGGSGGGRPDLARAGGNKPAEIEGAFEKLKKQLSGAGQ